MIIVTRQDNTAGTPRLSARGILSIVALSMLLLGGCASKPYQSADVETSSFLDRSIAQEEGSLRVTAAVPDAGETEALTGLPLYQQGIQPLWLKIENSGASPVRVAIWSIDRDYFSPIEVAYKNRRKFSKQGYQDMERWFYENGLPRNIPPGSSRSGLVFTHLRPGTKGFNIDLYRDRQATSFTFFVSLPGFTPDYIKVDLANLYPPSQIRNMDEGELKNVLEHELPCCATDASGELAGGPLNVVLVGSPLAVRRSLLRGGWLETSAEKKAKYQTQIHRYLGSTSHATFTIGRSDGEENLRLHLWLTPWRVNSEPVWVGQIFYRGENNPLAALSQRYGIEDISALLSLFVEEHVAADIDSARNFLLQNFWYNHSLRQLGWTTGVGVSSVDNPASTFDDLGYFSDGRRVVLFLSEKPLTLDKAMVIYNRNDNKTALSEDE